MKKNLYFFIRHFISLLAATFLLQLVAGCSGYWEDSGRSGDGSLIRYK